MAETEAAPPVALDEARQEQARRYARAGRELMLLDLVLGAIYLIVWIAAGWHIALGEWVAARVASPLLQVALYAVLFGLPYFIIDLPLSFYSGYVLPHHYDQSTETLGGWIKDQVIGLVLSGVLGLLVLEVVYALLRALPGTWWLVAGGVMLLFTAVLSTLSPILIAPLFYKFTPLEDEDLAARLLALAERAGTQVKGVYRFDMSRRTKGANAAVIGLGATRRIILGDTLLEEFTADEIETVLAHELAHLVHHDAPLLVATNSALTLVSFWAASLVLRGSIGAMGLSSIADPTGMPILALTIAIIGLIAMPLGNAFSRWRERLADAYALTTTRKPAAFADAMTRLANQNLGEVDPARWVVVLLYSHPPLRDRITAARQFTEQTAG